jgi:hypothetical protein
MVSIVATRSFMQSEFLVVRFYIDGKGMGNFMLMTPEEAQSVGAIMELGAREANEQFEYIEQTYKEDEE